jgi:hypothetical protein
MDEAWKPSPDLTKTDNVYSMSTSAYYSEVPLTHASTTESQDGFVHEKSFTH